MQSDTVRLAKIAAKAELNRRLLDWLSNPIVSVTLSTILIEALQKVKLDGQPLMGENVGTLLEAGIIATPVMTALANSGTLKQWAESTGKYGESALKAIGGLAPLLAAVA